MGKEYDDTDDFSVYETDIETGVEQSRRARRKAKEKRKGNVADTYKADFDDDAGSADKEESFEEKYAEDFDDEPDKKNISDDDNKTYISSDELSSETPQPVSEEGTEIAAESSTAKDAEMKKVKKNKKPKSLKKKFFTILFSILGAYLVLVLVFLGITYHDGEPMDTTPATPTEMIKKVAEKTQEVVVGKVPDRTIVLMFVIDKEYDDVTGEYLYPRTDSIVLANYDNVNKRLSMLSIPRDTIIEVSDDMYSKLREEFPEPGKKQMKINAIYHYAGEEHGMEYLKDEIIRIFGVIPDYCVSVNFEGFNYIVDSIGGVEFEVPIDMVYDDPAQDLHINLQKGLQVLDGDKAQQFVRYRKDNYGNGYAGGDIERIGVQQAFLKKLMQKALSSETVFKNIFSYFNAFNKYVKTDASINDMARYATVLKSINMNDIVTETLPGDPAYIYGISGYQINESEASAMVYNTFYRPLSDIQEEISRQKEAENVEKSTDKKIQVLNGGYTDGMAGEIQNRFAEKGISVANIGTYNGEKKAETQIITAREGIGLDLVSCFDKPANVIVDSAQTAEAGYDIIVIVGIDEPQIRTGSSSVTASLTDVPLTLNVISGAERPLSDIYEADPGRNYTDYNFDDEDDEDEDYYAADEAEQSDEDDEADDNNSSAAYDEDEDEEEIDNTYDYTDNEDDEEPEEDEQEQDNEPEEDEPDVPAYDVYEDEVD